MRILLFCVCLSPVMSVFASDPTLIYLVRHAEKGPEEEDPPLTEAGHTRAEALVAFFEMIPIQAIYASPYKRTKSTIEPLARERGLEIQLRNPAKYAEMAAELKERVGQTILVSGHSNTVPDLIKCLGGPPPTIDHSDYDNLFLLILDGDSVTLQHFRFRP